MLLIFGRGLSFNFFLFYLFFFQLGSKHSEKHKGSSRDNASESLQKVTPTINIMGAKNKESTRKAKDKRSTSSSTKYSSSSSKNSGDKYSSKSKTNSSD